MRLVVPSLLAALAIVAAPGVGLAGEGCKAFDVVKHIFTASDTDASGTLTLGEYQAAGLERYGVPFADYDANGDGEATLDEYLALYDRHHPADEGIES